MKSAIKDLSWDEAVQGFRKNWLWWTSVLFGMLPRRLREALSRDPGYVEALVSGSGLVIAQRSRGFYREIGHFDLAAKDGENTRSRPLDLDDADVVLRLPDEPVLRKPLTLPWASRQSLGKVLNYEIERHSPLALNRIHWDFRVLSRDRARNQSHVEIEIVKREGVETALAACQRFGLYPSRAVVGAEAEAFVLNLPRKRSLSVRAIWRRHGLSLLMLLVALAGVANIIHDYNRSAATSKSLAAEVAKLKPETVAVRNLKNEIEGVRSGMHSVVDRKNAPLMISTLAEITKLLPDDSWVYDFGIEKGDLKLRGFSGHAAALIGIFDKSSKFRSAQFEAPITKGPSGSLDRFDLSLKLKGAS